MTNRRNLLLAAAALPMSASPTLLEAAEQDPVFVAIAALRAAHAKLDVVSTRAHSIEEAYFTNSRLRNDSGLLVGEHPGMVISIDGRNVSVPPKPAFVRSEAQLEELLPSLALNGDEADIRRGVREFEDRCRRDLEAYGVPDAEQLQKAACDEHYNAFSDFIDTVPTSPAGLTAYVSMIVSNDAAFCGALDTEHLMRTLATIQTALSRRDAPFPT